MKQNPSFWLVGLSASVGVGLISVLLFSGSWQKPAAPAQPVPALRSQVAAPTQAPAVHPTVVRPDPPATVAEASAPVRDDVVQQTVGPAQAVVRVKPDRVLATVNGVSITLKDLVPLPKDKDIEQMLSAERYEFLFARAIQRELTFQAASALGVELSEDQMQRLAEISAPPSEARPPGVLHTVQQNPENTEFEQRDFAGVALLAVLAERVGVPSAHVTSQQVEEYFQQHQSEYAQIPADPAQRSGNAWAGVDAEIRKKLTPALQAEHDKQMNRMMTELLNKANIVVTTQQ
jgi:hypothetical protein